MNLLDHGTYDDVRSLLGVGDVELPDEVLALPHWMTTVELELLDIDQGNGAVLSQYALVSAISPESSRTTNQSYFFRVVNQYALYSVAKQVLGTAGTIAPLTISDGRAISTRADDFLDRITPAINGGWHLLKLRVTDYLLLLLPSAQVPAASTRVMIYTVGVGSDPVTGS